MSSGAVIGASGGLAAPAALGAPGAPCGPVSCADFGVPAELAAGVAPGTTFWGEFDGPALGAAAAAGGFAAGLGVTLEEGVDG